MGSLHGQQVVPSCVRRPGMVGWMQNRRRSCSNKENQGLYWGWGGTKWFPPIRQTDGSSVQTWESRQGEETCFEDSIKSLRLASCAIPSVLTPIPLHPSGMNDTASQVRSNKHFPAMKMLYISLLKQLAQRIPKNRLPVPE